MATLLSKAWTICLSSNNLETGKTETPRPETVKSLSEVLGVSELYFYICGEVLDDFFPAAMSADVRDFLLDENNVDFINMAKKIYDTGVDIHVVLGVLEALSKYQPTRK